MVSENIVNIILKMEDQATKVAQKADDMIKKFGDSAQQSNNKATQSVEKLNINYGKAANEVSKVVTSAERVGSIGSKQFGRYNESIQKSIVNFNRLDDETQEMLRYLNQMSTKGRETFVGMSSKAQEAIAKFEALQNETKAWGTTFDYTRTKMSLMGTNVDSLKGKIQVVGSAIKTYVGDPWDPIKTKIISLADHGNRVANRIQSSFSNALTTVKNKVNEISNAFNGLGGIIASVIGGVGLYKVKDLTLGLAMTREQVTALTQATTGSADAAKELMSYWDTEITDHSLVSLNELAQAMNNIKMATGMTNEQLKSFTTVVNDIGQRAILMGKDSSEAMTLMTAAADGLNGNFTTLHHNFGITKEKLEDLGWTGAAEDVEGYQKALEEYLTTGGDLNEMMKTTPGLIALVKKQFTSAGRQIGEIFIPYIREALQWFLDLKKTCPEAAKYLILIAGAISLFTTLAPMLAPLVTVLGFINIQFIAIVAVAAAVAIAIYNAGKSFGWWKDVQTMMEAIVAGLRRLFDAFRNSPVVKQAIDDIKNAFYALLGIIQTIGGPLSDVLSKNDDGTIDIVHSLVEFFKQWGSTIYEVTKIVLGLYLAFKTYSTINSIIGEIIWKYKDLKDEIEILGEKIVDAKDKVTGFIDKFREIAPDKIDSLKTKFSGLKDTILSAKDRLIDFIIRLKEIAAEKIATLATKFRGLADAISLAAIKEKLLAAYQWLVNAATAVWNALLALNPVVLIVIALVALIAVIYEVGKAFGWWDNVQGMLAAIWAGIQNLWNAFINHPDVQSTIKILSDGWSLLCEVVGNVSNAFNILKDKLGPFGNSLSILLGPIGIIVDALRRVVCILLGCSPGIVPALRKTWEVFSEIFNNILSFIGGIISQIVGAIQPLIDIFVEIVTYLVEMFMPVWNLLGSILQVIWNYVSQLISIFQQFLSGQITLPQMLGMIWALIQQTFMTILTMIINFVFQWAGQLISSAINAASGFVNGIISFISQLPGRVWNWLVQTTAKIISAGSQWVNNAKQKAGEMVNGAATTVQQLPGKIYTEFIKVPDRIREAIPKAIAAALNFGKGIIDGVLNAMGIHSPGIVQNSITDEFNNAVQKIKDTIKPAGEYARQVGAEIVDKFGEPKLSLDSEDLMPYYDLDENPLENVDLAGMDLSSVSGGLDSAMGMTDDTNNMIGESYNALSAMMMTTLQNMVLQDQLAYGQIQSNDLATFQNISTGLNLNMLSMSNNLRTQLNNMLMTHKAAMTNATNTTRQQLSLMLNQTTKVVAEMRSAWSVMADSIISAAARIKNEATTYFNQLSSTIGTFYRKLQNPSQWGGSHDGAVRRPHGSPGANLMSRITSGMANALRRDNQTPSNVPVRNARKYINLPSATLEYLGINSSSNVSVADLIEGGLVNPLQLSMLASSGWADTANPNIQHIKKTAREWSMKGPAIMGTIDTGLAFKVKEFENGRPHISFESFQRMAEALFSAISYDFYYNSDKTGSWVTALQSGSVNCWDGAHALIALARTCGFDGSIAHGTWNGIAHVYAIINGKKMDTTGWQQRRNWNGVAAGAPRNPLRFRKAQNMDIGSIIDELFDFFDGGDKPSAGSAGTVEEVKLTLEHNVNVKVDGETENIDVKSLIEELKASITDKNLIDKIADALIKRDKRIARMGGA